MLIAAVLTGNLWLCTPNNQPVSTRPYNTFTEDSISILLAGGNVLGGDGRLFAMRNGVPTTIAYKGVYAAPCSRKRL